MKTVLKLLQGETPSTLQLILTYGLALLGAAMMLWLAGTNITGVILAVIAADWFGGIVANSARSTRAFWAQLPSWTKPAFVIVHLCEVPIIYWLVSGDQMYAFLLPILGAKLAVFLIGQAEHRTPQT